MVREIRDPRATRRAVWIPLNPDNFEELVEEMIRADKDKALKLFAKEIKRDDAAWWRANTSADVDRPPSLLQRLCNLPRKGKPPKKDNVS